MNRGFINKDGVNADGGYLAEHAAHRIDVMGIDHTGYGFDF